MNTQCQKAFPAMVQPVPQHAGNVFSPGQALQNGTLFPELYKPMNGRQCSGGCYGDEAQMLNFAAWDMRLYLDTHPCDQYALSFYHEMCRRAPQPGYACAFAGCNQDGWHWTDDPWPWEMAANAGRV